MGHGMSLKFEVIPYHCQCKHKLCLSSKASSSSSYSSSRLQSKAYPGVCLQSTPVQRWGLSLRLRLSPGSH